MDDRITSASVVGAVVMVTFALGILVLFSDFSLDFVSTVNATLFNLAAVLMAPIAGGFVAGLIGSTNPRQAGLLAGLGGAFVILFSWLAIAGLSLETTLSGLVIGLVWVFLSRLGAGFSSAKKSPGKG